MEGSPDAASRCLAQFLFVVVVVAAKYPKKKKKQGTGVKIGFDSWLQTSQSGALGVLGLWQDGNMEGHGRKKGTYSKVAKELREDTGQGRYTLPEPSTLLSNIPSNPINCFHCG